MRFFQATINHQPQADFVSFLAACKFLVLEIVQNNWNIQKVLFTYITENTLRWRALCMYTNIITR